MVISQRRKIAGSLVAGLVAVAASGLVTSAEVRAAVECRAEVNRNSVPVGEDIVLTVSAQGDVGWSPDFQLPDLPGIRVFGGGTNQSMTVVNGQAQTSVSRTFYLKVDVERDFTIGPVRLTTSAGVCSTEPIAIKVVPGNSPPPAVSGNRVPPPAGGRAAPRATAGDDIFVTLDADKSEVWLGQQVILTFRYWWLVRPWSNPEYKQPRTEGFWREGLGPQRDYREIYQGRAYNVAEMRYALFPTRAGELLIEPAELVFPEDLFDRFLNSRQQPRGPRILRTKPITMTVKELPRPQPAGFSGIAASQFDLKGVVDRDSVPRGDAVSLRIDLVTDGFLKGFSGIKVSQPEGARLHDASENFVSTPTPDRLVGRLKSEKVLVTTREGMLRVPAVTVSWFDVARGVYRTSSTAEKDVAVVPSDRPQAGIDDSGFLRSEIARVGDDLAFIHPVPERIGAGVLPAAGGAIWWTLLLLPVLSLAVFRWNLERITGRRRDAPGRRRRTALATAKKMLRTAGGVDDSLGALTTVVRAVTGYVADCTGRPAAAVGASDVFEYAQNCGCQTTGQSLVDLLDKCDQARFGGMAASDAATAIVAATGWLTELDLARRSAARGRPTLACVALMCVLGMGIAVAHAGDDRQPGDDARQALAEGNLAYTDGRFDEALGHYLRARAQGADVAALHYNLGNTYARTGDVGRAVASYLRAQRQAPRDQDVHRNLARVRKNLKDIELADASLPLFIAQGAAVVGLMSTNEWALVLVGAVWLLAVTMGWIWYQGRETGGQWRFRTTGIVMVVVLGVIVGARWYQERVRDQAVVVAESVEVRSGPASSFSTLFEVHAGLALNVEGIRDDWARVSLGGDWVGWLPCTAVENVRLTAAEMEQSQASPR